MILAVGSSLVQISKNGEITAVDCGNNVILRNDRTYMPLRFVAENFGYTVEWNGDSVDLFSIAEIPVYDGKHEREIKLFAAFPRIYRENTADIYAELIAKLKNSLIDGFLVTSVGLFDMVKGWGFDVAIDYNMNVFNNEAVEYYRHKGADSITMSDSRRRKL